MRKIIFYTTQSGKTPIADFLDSLNAKQASQKTPKKEIVIAENRKSDYLRRKGE